MPASPGDQRCLEGTFFLRLFVMGFVLTGFVLMVCLSVCFVKQHSSVDVFAALLVCLLAEVILYGKDYWLPKLKSMTAQEKEN